MAVTITVELNFTGSTWTDVSAYLESEVSISGGRQDELSQADANQCSLTLDNRDGRFTPGKTSGAYYPNVKVGVGLRVSVDVNGSGTSRRFTGFVDSWQLDWSDGQDAAKVQVQASSIMARLGLLSERRSAIEEEILEDAPDGYWPMSDPEGSVTASEQSGKTSGDMYLQGDGALVVFGSAIGPPADGLTAAQFFRARYLRSDIASTPRTIEAFVLVDPSLAGSSAMLVRALGSGGDTTLRVNTSGQVVASTSGASVTSSTSIVDGLTHHVALTIDPITPFALTLYVDGSPAGSASGASPVATTRTTVGNDELNAFGALLGTVAHVATHPTALSAARIADHYAAGMTGFAGETAATRLARYAAWGKVTSYSTAATTPVAADEPAGASLVDLMHNVETAEGGVLYDERDNTLTLKTRQSRLTAVTAVTFNAAADQLESAFSPVIDRQGLTNEVTVTGGDGTVAVVADTASQASYGVARTSIDMVTTEPQQPLARAQWEIAAHSTPRERVPTLGVDVLNCGITPATLLALTVGSRVAVTNPPSQAAGPGDYFIEGWSEAFDPTSYNATFNVSPAQPWVNTFILDDATRGILDSTYILAY